MIWNPCLHRIDALPAGSALQLLGDFVIRLRAYMSRIEGAGIRTHMLAMLMAMEAATTVRASLPPSQPRTKATAGSVHSARALG